MAGHRVTLPTIQNWNCHSCGNCCRQHLITVSDVERQRILDQQWSADDGIDPDRPILVWHSGPPWKKQYRLGHREDGACVFLDEQGLCRIHAKFGEAAKPFPCRIYPFAFHAGGDSLTVSLRFSCPSVVANRGNPVSAQANEIKNLANAVVPEGAKKVSPPQITPKNEIDWRDFHRFIDALDATMADDAPLLRKLLRALFWMELVEKSTFQSVRGARLTEFLNLISEAADAEIPKSFDKVGEPSRLGRMLFRMLVAQYARKDTLIHLESGLKGRGNLLLSAFRFARGRASGPPLR